MPVDSVPPAEIQNELQPADIVFATLPLLGMDRMTAEGVEFVLCASALTAQV
jgi:hypothetical protein